MELTDTRSGSISKGLTRRKGPPSSQPTSSHMHTHSWVSARAQVLQGLKACKYQRTWTKKARVSQRIPRLQDPTNSRKTPQELAPDNTKLQSHSYCRIIRVKRLGKYVQAFYPEMSLICHFWVVSIEFLDFFKKGWKSRIVTWHFYYLPPWHFYNLPPWHFYRYFLCI